MNPVQHDRFLRRIIGGSSQQNTLMA